MADLDISNYNLSGIPKMQDYDWEHSVNGNPTGDVPTDAPPPLGKQIAMQI